MSDVVALDLGARLFAKTPCAWEIVVRRYEMIKPYATSSHYLLLNIPHQYSEALARPNPSAPWEMDGVFFGPSDLTAISELRLHQAVYHCFTLRLKLVYDAPLDELAATVEKAIETRDWSDGLSFGAEVYWMLGVAAIRLGTHGELIQEAKDFLKPYTQFSPDLLARLQVLEALEAVQVNALSALSIVEPLIDSLEDAGQNFLSGMLNFWMADVLVKQTGSSRLVSGFIRSAYLGYQKSDCAGLCSMLAARMPTDVAAPQVGPRSASDYIGHDTVPPRASISSHGVSDSPVPSTVVPPHEDKIIENLPHASVADNLDTLT